MATATLPAPEHAAAGAAGTGLPPGPRMPALAQTLAWALAPTWLMDRCAKRVGDAFTLTFWPSGLQLVMLAERDAVKRLFTAAPELAPSAARFSPVTPVVGASSVLVLTGAEHMRQRKLLLPPFHGERMREYEDVMAQATRRDMATWSLGRPMRMQPHMRAITLEVILQAVFGVEAERMGPLKAAITDLFAPAQTLTVLRAVLRRPNGERPTGEIGRALDRLDELVYQEIARRRADGGVEQRNDIMSLLLGARDASSPEGEDGEAMTDDELRDELVTLLLAGHETTSTSVAWALERLVRHPAALARLTAEIDAGEGDEYMTAVVNETLRVRPVVPVVARILQGELDVGDWRLPAGTRVVPSIYLVNRSARLYEHPAQFRPERFLETAPETFSWIPFGGGIRRCIGAAFAQLEMKVMLRTMLGEMQPRTAGGRRAAVGGSAGARAGVRGERIRRRAITLVPAAGARVVWERRQLPGGPVASSADSLTESSV